MTVDIIDRSLIRCVTTAAALIATIQAATWVCLSLISILIHNYVIEIDYTLPPYSYQYILHQIFLNPDYASDEIIVNSNVFHVFMIINVTINFVWLIVSLYILWAMTRDKWKNVSYFLGGWSGITMLISSFDIIVMSLVAADYITVQSLSSQLTTQSPISTTPSITLGSTTYSTLLTDSTMYSPTVESTYSTTLEPTYSTTLEPTYSTTLEPTFSTTLEPTFSTTLEPTTLESTSTSESTYSSTLESTTTFGSDALPLGSFAKSFLDIIAVDERVFEDFDDELLKQIVYGSYVIVITLAVRGYILWIMNVVFAIILMKFGIALSRQAAPSLLPMIDGYSTGRAPWGNLYEQTDIGNGYSNGAFTDDNDRAIFPRSDSFINAEQDIKHQNPLSKGANPYAQQIEKLRPVSSNPNIVNAKVAKIGKQNGRRTPPRNVPPPNIPQSNSPYIPDPDYSPPGSPLKPKSVLRPRSNYVL